MSVLSFIPPSAYEWLIPDAMSIQALDELALNGQFPRLLDLYPSVLFAFAFGIARMYLQGAMFEVSAFFSQPRRLPQITHFSMSFFP
jgi:hypothetical protein